MAEWGITLWYIRPVFTLQFVSQIMLAQNYWKVNLVCVYMLWFVVSCSSWFAGQQYWSVNCMSILMSHSMIYVANCLRMLAWLDKTLLQCNSFLIRTSFHFRKSAVNWVSKYMHDLHTNTVGQTNSAFKQILWCVNGRSKRTFPDTSPTFTPGKSTFSGMSIVFS